MVILLHLGFSILDIIYLLSNTENEDLALPRHQPQSHLLPHTCILFISLHPSKSSIIIFIGSILFHYYDYVNNIVSLALYDTNYCFSVLALWPLMATDKKSAIILLSFLCNDNVFPLKAFKIFSVLISSSILLCLGGDLALGYWVFNVL